MLNTVVEEQQSTSKNFCTVLSFPRGDSDTEELCRTVESPVIKKCFTESTILNKANNRKIDDVKKGTDNVHYELFIICLPVPILTVARSVAILSATSLLLNLIIVVFGGSTAYASKPHIPENYDMISVMDAIDDNDYMEYTEHNSDDASAFIEVIRPIALRFFELILYVMEFCVILSLYYGIKHRAPKYLRPYLIFNLIWNIALFVIWVFCFVAVAQRREDFIFQVLLNTSNFLALYQPDDLNFGVRLSVVLLFVLSLAIIVGFWFLHIILTTYLYLINCSKLPKNGCHSNEATTVDPQSPSENAEETSSPLTQPSSQPQTPPFQPIVENRRYSRRFSRATSVGQYQNVGYVPYSPPHHYKYQHNFV